MRLYEDGFKDRYYESKFGVLPSETKFRHRVAYEYTIGLCWVLRYYYQVQPYLKWHVRLKIYVNQILVQGCASWKWYFPYHYAPFASDFVDLDDVPTEFERDTKPFNPLEQLMGVFPAASRAHVPM